MILTTTAEARALDKEAMESYGLPEAVLMENAGAAVVRLAGQRLRWDGAQTVIVCGAGNNGGDGFVAARYAAEAGAEVTVLFMGNAAHMGPSSRMYRQAAEKMSIPVVEIGQAADALPYFAEASVIVDALIGTGISKEVAGEKAALISFMNDASAAVISVDMPSGLSGDTGRPAGTAVMADITVALGSLKRGHVLYPGSDFCGEVFCSSIGIPEAAGEGCPVRLMEARDVRRLLPVRTRISHKGNNGFIGLFAGSAGMEGAALLAAQGALYAGGGKIALRSVQAAAGLLAGRVPEVMVGALGNGPRFTEAELPEALAAAAGYDAVAMGCGLGREETVQAFAEGMMRAVTGPFVLDADALWAAAERKVPLEDCPGDIIITPHVGEFSRLTGLSAGEIEARRIDCARDYAAAHHVTVVLKGAPTVTALPDGTAWVNSTGNPGMASGGMGDTLTGIIAALAGQGMDAGNAAACGVYLHGLAGDLAAKEAAVGYTASDVAHRVPLARETVMRGAEAAGKDDRA